MKTFAVALALALTFLDLGGCAYRRPCPPGYHLGPYGRACWVN